MALPFPSFGTVLFVWLACVALVGRPATADGASPRPVTLPAPETWERQSADVQARDATVELTVPVNYKIGRVMSPVVPASKGELFTFAAEVKTWFAAKQTQQLYRCWLEIELLREGKVVQTVPSPELLGTHDSGQVLGVTAVVPEEATGVRAVLCAQNKQWSLVDNRATARKIRLLRLEGRRGGGVRIEAAEGLPKQAGDRTAAMIVHADWPDGTALSLSSSRGSVPPVALLSRGRATIPLHYSAEDAGAATVTARLGEQEATLRASDPMAATLVLPGAVANGIETPVLVQLSRNGEVLPGRYGPSVKGIFVTPPWNVDLAPGQWKLRVSCGPRFRAAEQTIDARSGQTLTLDRLELPCIADLPALGWYGGDADGDVYHGELVYKDVNAQTAAHIARAMGLDWVGVGRWGVGGYGGPDPKTWDEARAAMRKLSRPDLLFLWTDERPKTLEGHACFVGLTRPDGDKFEWGWMGTPGRPLRNHELLGAIRASGAATFVNHPLRWWMKGERFNTNMYSSLVFDLCAAGRLDGLNINDKEANLQVWSMLLDHGYPVTATAGADFCLDRPGGPPPGLHRMYCLCPDGLSERALVEAVRRGHTVVSTGPTLLADIDNKPPGTSFPAGKSYQVHVRAWARGDQPDELARLELWSHGKVVATKPLDPGCQDSQATFDWTPQGQRDWVAVRAVSRGGWAMTSAFYAGEGWHPRESITCRLTLDVTGLTDAQRDAATVEVWDGPQGLVTSRRLSQAPLGQSGAINVPVTATVIVKAPDAGTREVSVYDAVGMAEWIEKIASGAAREQPLLDWKSYEDALARCRAATATLAF